MLARPAARLDELTDLLFACPASGPGPTFLADLVHGDRPRVDRSFDLTMGDALADADDHVSGSTPFEFEFYFQISKSQPRSQILALTMSGTWSLKPWKGLFLSPKRQVPSMSTQWVFG